MEYVRTFETFVLKEMSNITSKYGLLLNSRGDISI